MSGSHGAAIWQAKQDAGVIEFICLDNSKGKETMSAYLATVDFGFVGSCCLCTAHYM